MRDLDHDLLPITMLLVVVMGPGEGVVGCGDASLVKKYLLYRMDLCSPFLRAEEGRMATVHCREVSLVLHYQSKL